jgi:hypothetical protein
MFGSGGALRISPKVKCGLNFQVHTLTSLSAARAANRFLLVKERSFAGI